MKKILAIAMLCATLTGCALFSKQSTADQKAAEIQKLSYAAASVGTSIALSQNPAWRPSFELAYTNLNNLVTSKAITGQGLRDILSSLPVKELKSDTARIAIEGATTLFDATVGNNLNLESQPYILAASTGVRDGLKTALGK